MFDVIVVGGGHAGCEASLACARLGHKTMLITGNIKNTITRMFDYTGVYRVLNKLMASVSKIIQLSKELDSTMFNLRVVTGDSREETAGLIGDYRKLADQLGATTVQIANAANEWLN